MVKSIEDGLYARDRVVGEPLAEAALRRARSRQAPSPIGAAAITEAAARSRHPAISTPVHQVRGRRRRSPPSCAWQLAYGPYQGLAEACNPPSRSTVMASVSLVLF
ncbi:hypothetical protein ABZ589_22995 [Streptomyces sp. NPDC013313]|uniref:hypothetical protein n=1 Tax=Streptomyces sp. NPDC013313 TaxID=3155603 RepID=UPI0033DA8D87